LGDTASASGAATARGDAMTNRVMIASHVRIS
jgi:hypothetical protein